MSFLKKLFGGSEEGDGRASQSQDPATQSRSTYGARGKQPTGPGQAGPSHGLPTDLDKYRGPHASATVEAFNGMLRNIVRERFQAHVAKGGTWDSFVFDASYNLFTEEDCRNVEKALLDAGHRYDWSAMISVTERPDVYKAATGLTTDLSDYSFEHEEAPTAPPDADGRELRGIGDNVVSYPQNTIGTARYIRSLDMVMTYLQNGAPPETIAIIDDSGGTLTAPILEQFKGVICAGGTVRSHLGILTREYGIPCLMNAKVSGLKEGDTVEIESSAPAKTAKDYTDGNDVSARVWRLSK
ncbi:MAG: PEP-utilizing enzyme [Pseudomonadota bacterium]